MRKSFLHDIPDSGSRLPVISDLISDIMSALIGVARVADGIVGRGIVSITVLPRYICV
jgi:hypothetical protein